MFNVKTIFLALVMALPCVAGNELTAKEVAVLPEKLEITTTTPSSPTYERKSPKEKKSKPQNPTSRGRGAKGSRRGGHVTQQPRKGY